MNDAAHEDAPLAELLELVANGVYHRTPAGAFTSINGAFAAILGLEPAALRARPALYREALHPEDAARVEAAWEEDVSLLSFRIVRPDGSLRWLEERRQPLAGGVGGCVRDLTGQREAMRTLKESEERLQTALDALEGGVWNWNVQTGDVDFSPRWPRMLGFEPTEIEPHVRAWATALHPDDQERVLGELNDHLDHGSPYRTEHRLRTKAGKWIWVMGRGRVTEWDKDGKPLRMVGTNVDISDRKQAEAERLRLETVFRETQKLESLGLLAGGIAHDFNNLLTSILGCAELASASIPEGSDAQPLLEQIVSSSQHAARLCRQLLAYAGKSRFQRSAVDLSALVGETVDLLRVSIPPAIALDLALEPALPTVEGDAGQIHQVVLNLLTNAAEAIEDAKSEPGRIGVRTGSVDGQTIFLEVSDDGAGMNAETRARIYEPFFTTKFAGRGLGLAAVQGIVRRHRGRIELASEPGRGTCFRVLLPASVAPPGPAAKVEDDGTWHGEGLVLLIDDDRAVRTLARRLLEQLGFTVVEAEDGSTGLDIYAARRDAIRAVLLDLTMPGMDGIACLDALRAIDPGVRVILTSGYNEAFVRKRYGPRDSAGFLEKPYLRTTFRDVLREALRGP